MNPLFITAHYDDLEVCAGGTAKRYGGFSVVLTPKPSHGTEKQATAAAAILGIDPYAPPHWPLTLDEIEALALGCDTIISVSPHDSHPEHQEAATFARQVARKNGIALWFMDHAIPGGYGQGPRPNHFINISDESTFKYGAIRTYKNVMHRYGKGWLPTIASRDRYYGGIHGTYRAEGFTVQNSIQ